MSLTLLLDLDDTLLDTHPAQFIPAYFQALSEHLSSRLPPEAMLAALKAGTRRMLDNLDGALTLQQVFENYFYAKLGVSRQELSGTIEQFYDEVFPTLHWTTQKRPGAAELVGWALAQGYRLVVATNPLFPRKATYHRIRWAGLDPECFELVSTFEDFHFAKPHPEYLAELLGRLGWAEGPVLMVGNDVELDLKPARTLGLKSYHVVDPAAARLAPEWAVHGTLSELRAWLEAVDMATLEPEMQSPAAILSVLRSTPAVLPGLTAALSPADWSRKPRPDEWAMIEVVCHLRDTEREIHQLQIKTLLERADAFIPRPDGGVWAKQRNYLEESGPAAEQAFGAARAETLAALASLQPDTWQRKARHAIFGPTHFREVIGFMAEHDRMHVQQAWKVLKTL